MDTKFVAGDKTYIVESNRFVSEVTVMKYSGGFYMIKLASGGAIRVKVSRLFATENDARGSIMGQKTVTHTLWNY